MINYGTVPGLPFPLRQATPAQPQDTHLTYSPFISHVRKKSNIMIETTFGNEYHTFVVSPTRCCSRSGICYKSCICPRSGLRLKNRARQLRTVECWFGAIANFDPATGQFHLDHPAHVELLRGCRGVNAQFKHL